MNTVITARHVSCTLNNTLILDDLSFDIAAGSFVGIIGPNGAGKSTLLKCVSRAYPCFEGAIAVNELDIRRYSQRRLAKIMAVLPSELLIPFDFTVYEIVSMGRTPHMGLFGPLSAHDTRLIADAHAATDTAHLASRSIHEISSGEKQRVFIAQALCQEPKIILLDEPTAHLDLIHQKEIMDLLKTLHITQRVTVVMVSHDINLAAQYCSRIILLKQGVIVADGEPAQIVNTDVISVAYGKGVGVHIDEISRKRFVYVQPNHTA
jgi:iron complex transport system ATP-binding protein